MQQSFVFMCCMCGFRKILLIQCRFKIARYLVLRMCRISSSANSLHSGQFPPPVYYIMTLRIPELPMYCVFLFPLHRCPFSEWSIEQLVFRTANFAQYRMRRMFFTLSWRSRLCSTHPHELAYSPRSSSIWIILPRHTLSLFEQFVRVSAVRWTGHIFI